VGATEKTIFYAVPSCHNIPIEDAEFDYYYPLDYLEAYFDYAKECDVELIVIDEGKAKEMVEGECQSLEDVSKLSRPSEEVFCDFIERVASMDTPTQSESVSMMVELGVITGVASKAIEEAYTIYLFMAGKVRYLNDGSISLVEYANNLRSSAKDIHDNFKNAGTLQEIAEMPEVGDNILALMSDQMTKMDSELAAGDIESAVIRGIFLNDFSALDGWIFKEGSLPRRPDITEIKYEVVNCITWLLSNPNVDKVQCGSSGLYAGTFFSPADLIDVPEMRNLTIQFDYYRDAAVFSPEYGYATFDGEILEALQDVSIGMFARSEGDSIVVEFGNG
jgi:hypothetical protein